MFSMFTVPTATLVINEPAPSPVIPGPTSVIFKDIFDTANTIQVNNDPDDEYHGNVEVLTTNGTGYVFMGDDITPESRSIAYGPGIESGSGWVRINALTVEAACEGISSTLSAS